jgi:hypothetical protein
MRYCFRDAQYVYAKAATANAPKINKVISFPFIILETRQNREVTSNTQGHGKPGPNRLWMLVPAKVRARNCPQ